MNIDFIDNVVDFLDSIDTVDWPVKSGESSKKNKEKLILLAKSGKERPNSRTSLGKSLSNYTIKGSKSYNPDFDKEIRSLRPEWFQKSSIKKKEELILLAKSGEKRPDFRTRLGKALCHYTNKSNGSYDEQFDKEIKQIRINWFRIK